MRRSCTTSRAGARAIFRSAPTATCWYIRQGSNAARGADRPVGAERLRNGGRDACVRESSRPELLGSIVTNCPPEEFRHDWAAGRTDHGGDVERDQRCRRFASARFCRPGKGSSPPWRRLVRRVRAADLPCRPALPGVPRSPVSGGRFPVFPVDDDWPNSRSAESA